MSARASIPLAGLLLLGACAYGYARHGPAPTIGSFAGPRVVTDPVDNPRTPERVALGRDLFNDPRLSADGRQSCASCHQPERGFADGERLSPGRTGQRLIRHTPTLWNVGFAFRLFGDGRAASLEEQALMPVMSGAELGRHPGTVVDPIRADRTYRTRFANAFPEDPQVSEATVSKAIAAYERTLVSGDTPFDDWARGDVNAISPAARRGFALFTGRANCASCHVGPNLTDNRFHDVGLPDEDLGRGAITKRRSLDHAFRTPSLREIGRTAPYMHDGSLPTLEAVVDHYSNSLVRRRTAPKPSMLTPDEKADLVAFLKTLDAARPAPSPEK